MTRMTTDYDSVLANARISAIMLDGDLRIRSFSREVVRVFNLIDKDEGHHINRISHHLGEIDVGACRSSRDRESIGVAIVIQGPMD